MTVGDLNGRTSIALIMTDSPFRWAVGVECSFIPHLGVDQYRWTQHDRFWRNDFELVANDLDCRWMRYSLPWHQIETEPGRYDWQWFDDRLAHAEALGITLLLDLAHFGTPTWLPDAFADVDFPVAIERFARAFGERYRGRVHHVCPVNEPLITALFCGDVGLWPPYGRGLQTYMPVLTRIAQGICRAIKVLRETMPGVEILISDSLEVAATFEDSDEKSSPFLKESLRADVARRMERRHVVLDLIMGRVTKKHPLHDWLERHGFPSYDLRWFERNAQTIDVIGLDYYEHTEVELYTTPEGYYRQRALQPPMGLYRAAQDYWTRYHIPLMVTETSVGGTDEDKIRWLERSTADVRRLRAEGFPVVGYTWWPVIDHLDWDGALLHQTGHIHPVGIYRLEREAGGKLTRHPTGLRDAYRALILGGDETAGALLETEAQREQRESAASGSIVRKLRYPIILHARTKWDRALIWRRGQHVAAHLSKDHPVLYIDPIHWTDDETEYPRAGMSYSVDYPNVSNLIIHLPATYRGDDKLVRQECRRLLAETLAQTPLAGHFDAPVQWFDDAAAASIFGGQVNSRAVVYTCLDAEPDTNLLSLADVVFAGSKEIQKTIVAQGRADSHLTPNGVQVKHFLRAAKGYRMAVPHDINFVPRPMLVYFGTIDERIDFPLIHALAENNDAWSIVMVGPIEGVVPEHLPRRRNIFWIGRRPYGEIPDYAFAAHVCIAPFIVSEATKYQRPIKIGEYLMSGRPVVSTALPEVQRDFADVVAIADSHAGFIEACHKGVHEQDEKMIERGKRRMAAQGWPKLVASMDETISQALASKGVPTA